jgi:hypothetical protein
MTKKTNKQDTTEPIERIKDGSSEIEKEPPVTFMGFERRYPPVTLGELKRYPTLPSSPFERIATGDGCG